MAIMDLRSRTPFGRGKRTRRLSPPRRSPLPKIPLVTKHLGLVKSVARRYARRFPGAEIADLVQEGHLGLLRAGKLFKKRRGAAFSTFAVPHIENRIRRAAQRRFTVRVPERALRRRKGKGVFTIGGLKGERIAIAGLRGAPVSEGGIAQAHARASLSRVLKRLPHAHRNLLRLRYLNGQLTISELAKKLGKSRSTVHGLERKALAAARRASMNRRAS